MEGKVHFTCTTAYSYQAWVCLAGSLGRERGRKPGTTWFEPISLSVCRGRDGIKHRMLRAIFPAIRPDPSWGQSSRPAPPRPGLVCPAPASLTPPARESKLRPSPDPSPRSLGGLALGALGPSRCVRVRILAAPLERTPESSQRTLGAATTEVPPQTASCGSLSRVQRRWKESGLPTSTTLFVKLLKTRGPTFPNL